MTPKERGDAIYQRMGPMVYKAHFQQLNRLVHAAGSRKKRMQAVFRLCDGLATFTGDEVACRPGCSYCCHQAVAITQAEAELISDFTGQPYVPSDGIDVDTLRGQHTGTPCPFLKDHRCSIYPVRPVACRTHYSLEDSLTPCDTDVPVKVFYLNTQLYKMAAGVIGGMLGDIRDWFPEAPGGGK